MSIEITRPLMILTDSQGQSVGVTDSLSEVEAMEKASTLPDGTYLLVRPTATILVDQETVLPDPVPDPIPDPVPDPIPAPGAQPSWRAAQQAMTWVEIPTANLLSDLNPRYSQVINPLYPNNPEFMGEHKNVVEAWCGACKDGTRFIIPAGTGGHTDYGGNEPYEIDLMSNAPIWIMRRPPTGSLPGAMVTRDGQEATGLFADGRIRPVHTYNAVDYIPGQGPVHISRTGSWLSGQTFNHRPVFLDDDGEIINTGAPCPETSGSGVYDPVRHGLWSRATGTGRYWFYDIATDSWTAKGLLQASTGVAGITCLPNGLLFVRRWNDWYIVDPDAVTESKIATTGTGAILPTRSTQRPIYANGAIWLWDNTVEEGTEKLTRLTVPANPKTDVWHIDTILPSSANTVTPTPRAVNGTYGRFQYFAEMNGFLVFNSTNQRPFFFALSDGG